MLAVLDLKLPRDLGHSSRNAERAKRIRRHDRGFVGSAVKQAVGVRILSWPASLKRRYPQASAVSNKI